MNKCGVLFIFNYTNKQLYELGSTHRLSNHNKLVKNKKIKKKRIGLLKITLFFESNSTTTGFSLVDTEREITLKNIESFLKSNYTLDDNDIIDYNSIHSKLVKNANANTNIFVVLLNHEKHDVLVDKLRNKHGLYDYTKLLFYDNNNILSLSDVPTAVCDYHKSNNICLDPIRCFNNEIYIESLIGIIDTLNGII